MIEAALATCIFLAAENYSVPPAVLMGIMKVEGGKIGQQVKNTNGSYDLGPMQINTIWLPELAKHWKVSKSTAKKWVKDDGCTNVGVAAWILRKKASDAGSIYTGIAHYHSKTPSLGTKYRRKVIKAMHEQGLLQRKVLAYKRANHKTNIKVHKD